MGTGGFVPTSIAQELRSTAVRIGVALGLGFVVLVVVPMSAAAGVTLTGGPGSLALGLLAVGLLGFLLVLAALPVAVVALGWVLLGAAVTTVEAHVTERRLRVLNWAETVEATRWWGPFVRPAERLALLDPLSDEDRLEAALARAKSAYVSGELSEVGLERRLDQLFGLGPDASTYLEADARNSRTEQADRSDLWKEAATERSTR